MKRTQKEHRILKSFKLCLKSATAFISKNIYAIFFVTLILIGVAIGCFFFSFSNKHTQEWISSVLVSTVDPKTLTEGCLAVVGAAFYICLILVSLFMLGLTPYGGPIIIVIAVFFGFCVGITECRIYIESDVVRVISTFLPHILIAIFAVIVACIQSLKMSCIFSRQLLPTCAHCGGLWSDFKLYLLRFLFCMFLAFLSSALHIVLQII